MDSTQFIYWLQGYLELSDATTLSQKQLQIIKDHIGLVMQKKTPNRSNTEIPTATHPIDFGIYCSNTEIPTSSHPIDFGINCAMSC